MKTNMKIIRKKAGLTQEQASNLSGIPLGTLRRWEQGVNEPDMESIINLAGLYGVSTDTLLGSRFAEKIDGVEHTMSRNSFVDVPLYGSIAAGTPMEMTEADDWHPVPTAVHDKHPNGFLLRVEGSSMDRVLPDGCFALVDPCTDVDRDGAPYAVCVNGYDATIKRVRRLNNGFVLEPDSTDPTYQPAIYNFNDPDTQTITVIGRVVYYVLPFDWEF